MIRGAKSFRAGEKVGIIMHSALCACVRACVRNRISRAEKSLITSYPVRERKEEEKGGRGILSAFAIYAIVLLSGCHASNK